MPWQGRALYSDAIRVVTHADDYPAHDESINVKKALYGLLVHPIRPGG